MSDHLGTSVNTVEVRTLKAVYDVRSVLPKLAKQSRRWSAARICPVCKGPKSTEAKQCRTCHSRSRHWVKAGRPDTAIETPSGVHYGSKWGASAERRAGHVRAGPPLKRQTKMPDGTWMTQE
jgi:ribosomal protein L40E